MLLIKNDGHTYKTKKIGGGCHHLLLVYDASKLSTVELGNKELFGRPKIVP